MEKKGELKMSLILFLIVAVVMLAISLIFFVLLSYKADAEFGFKEILYSVVFAIVITFFLLWLRSFMLNRPYIGVVIGLIGIAAGIYGIFLRYRGPYTIAFVIFTSIIILVYVSYYFIKFRKKETETQEDFDDNLLQPSK